MPRMFLVTIDFTVITNGGHYEIKNSYRRIVGMLFWLV